MKTPKKEMPQMIYKIKLFYFIEVQQIGKLINKKFPYIQQTQFCARVRYNF